MLSLSEALRGMTYSNYYICGTSAPWVLQLLILICMYFFFQSLSCLNEKIWKFSESRHWQVASENCLWQSDATVDRHVAATWRHILYAYLYKHLSDHYSRPDLRIYTWTLVDRLSYSPYYSITAGDTDFQNEIKMQSIRHVSKRAYGHAFYISDWYQSFRTVDSMLPPLPLATYLVAKIIMSKSKVQRKWKVYMLTICCLLSHVWPTLLALSRGKMQNLLG